MYLFRETVIWISLSSLLFLNWIFKFNTTSLPLPHSPSFFSSSFFNDTKVVGKLYFLISERILRATANLWQVIADGSLIKRPPSRRGGIMVLGNSILAGRFDYWKCPRGNTLWNFSKLINFWGENLVWALRIASFPLPPVRILIDMLFRSVLKDVLEGIKKLFSYEITEIFRFFTSCLGDKFE